MARLTEIKILKLQKDCYKNPVYFAWINQLGGWDYWLFGATQAKSIDVSGASTIRVFNETLSGAEAVIEVLKKEGNHELMVGAEGLLKEDIDGIQGMLTSHKVQMMVSKVPLRWVTVLVATGKYKLYDTGDNRGSVEISVSLPSLFLQSQ